MTIDLLALIDQHFHQPDPSSWCVTRWFVHMPLQELLAVLQAPAAWSLGDERA
jgi:hypothetical protein